MTKLDDACRVFTLIPDALAVVDDAGCIACANPALEALVGYPAGALRGIPVRVILPNGRDATACVTASGNVFPVSVRRAAAELGGRSYTICTVHDRRDELLARADLYAEAHTDALTGLGNRLVLQRRLDALTADDGTTRPVAVLTVDVDHFKDINDTYGHAVGDAVLAHVAERLRASVRPEDTVIRVGGDEFVVVSDNVGAHDAEALGTRVLSAMEEPMEADGHVLSVGLSVGVAAGTHPGATPQELLAASDQSLYEAKRQGRGRRGPTVTTSPTGHTTIDLRDRD